MKIIDLEKKGNVVRFYLGDDDCNDYWGDDWDDAPYEHNAGTVYHDFVKGIKEIAFPFDFVVEEPSDDYVAYHHNTPFCKKDFIERKAPALVAAKVSQDDWSASYSTIALREDCIKYFFGDPMEPGPCEVYKG